MTIAKLAIGIALCGSSVIASGPALAWGDEGHKIVAEIAWERLPPRTRAIIQRMLAADASDGLTAPDFVNRATWADRFRDVDHPPHGVTATPQRNPHYFGTHFWHFIDIPLMTPDAGIGAAGNLLCRFRTLRGPASLGAPPEDCVTDKIDQFAAELSSPGTRPAERLLALKFLLHFVGDVHQPLHAADDQDRGGNCVFIQAGPRGGVSNLHAYWDTVVVRRLMNGMTPEAYGHSLSIRVSPAMQANWERGTPEQWAGESFRLARDFAYQLGASQLPTCATSNPRQPLPLPPGYAAGADRIAREQLARAGVRLARLLTDALQ